MSTQDTSPVPIPSSVVIATTKEQVYKVGGQVVPPRLVLKATPTHILLRCQEGAWFDGGAFIFEAVISSEGDVREIQTIKSPRISPSCPELEQAYRQAISAWKYKPATLDGKPVPVSLTISVLLHP